MTLNNVPLASQSLGVTQPLIQGNFQTIDAAFLVDHVPYTLSGQGKHNRVSFPVQGSTPTFDAGEEGLYNAAYVISGKNELFVHKQDLVGTRDVPMTASILSTTSVGPAITNNVWGYLPSGLALLSGFTSGTGVTSVSLGAPIVTGTTKIIGVVVSPYTGTAVAANYVVSLIGVQTATSFTVFVADKNSSAPATGQFSWMAIISPT
jgi:hypothetical protein